MTSSIDTPSQEGIQVVGREVRSMFGAIAGRYDLANSVLSMGIHKWWRSRLAKIWKNVGAEQPVLDLCCGTGDILFELRKSFPEAYGADFCLPMMRCGQARSPDTPFLQADALHLPFQDQTFGLITVAFGVRNLESVEQGLTEMLRVLKPNGTLLVLEFGQPRNVMWRMIFDFYSGTILPFIGELVTGNRSAYEYLPKTSKNFPCRELFKAKVKSVGFAEASYTSLTGGVAYIYTCTKGPS
ncbi:MAG: bifunctional demethylmenaquinone methyltransferase/2-methoxy-6-polyprenyl-1,4-benzoquinol methylase UbiE [Bdellovibrionales bacterium]|nr:bifunctional demethylmenaquinone methyltransferase/2-methoxy-6-polyprenyl-1,4-benzoquinol methylase UbiE [Bdellovibrionales bacterium]